MKVQAGKVTAHDPDHIDITGPGYHIRIVEDRPGVFLITGLTDRSLSSLVIRPTSRNQIRLVEDAGRITPVARPHRVLDAQALDVWVEQTHYSIYQHWLDREADRIGLWEYITEHQSQVWQEFEKWFLAKMLELTGLVG